MIGSLRGTLIEVLPYKDGKEPVCEVLIECGGVGYRVLMSTSSMAAIELGSPTFLHVHSHVREDAFTLYGFFTRDERATFEALIGAHGVGPSLALALLSAHNPSRLHRIVESNDVDALCEVPGVGKKTATKLLVELKSRLGNLEFDIRELDGATNENDAMNEVRTALAGLGYGADEIREATRHLDGSQSADAVLRDALRRLAVSQ